MTSVSGINQSGTSVSIGTTNTPLQINYQFADIAHEQLLPTPKNTSKTPSGPSRIIDA